MTGSNQKAAAQAARAIRTVMLASETGAKRGLQVVGVQFRNEIVKVLSKPGQGKVYRIGNTLHRASKPGDPPAVNTGSYRSSWRWWMEGDVLHVGTGDPRGPWLEKGTDHIAPRPHLSTATKAMQNKIPGLIAVEVIAAQRKTAQSLPSSYGG